MSGEEKKQLRTLIRQRKGMVSEEQRRAASDAVCSRIVRHDAWQKASTIMLYNALSDEVDLSDLIKEALHEGKRVLLPVVVGDSEMEVRLVTSATVFSSGSFGIREPEGEAFIDFEEIDLAIVPGMAFDAEGHRLGRGRGYYDRFLPRLKKAFLLGVCFSWQLVERVPTDAFDRRVDEVVAG